MDTTIIDKLRIYEQITRAIEVFNNDGRIVSMQVQAFPPLQPGTDGSVPLSAGTATVDTTDILYPPQMTEAILAALNARRQTIASELAELGVTGLGN